MKVLPTNIYSCRKICYITLKKVCIFYLFIFFAGGGRGCFLVYFLVYTSFIKILINAIIPVLERKKLKINKQKKTETKTKKNQIIKKKRSKIQTIINIKLCIGCTYLNIHRFFYNVNYHFCFNFYSYNFIYSLFYLILQFVWFIRLLEVLSSVIMSRWFPFYSDIFAISVSIIFTFFLNLFSCFYHMNLYNFLNSFFSYIIFFKLKVLHCKKKTYFVYIFDPCSQMPIKWFVLLIKFVTCTEENYFQLLKCIEREVKWKIWHISKRTTNQTCL